MAVVAPDLPSIISMVSEDAVAFFAHDDFDDFEATLREVLTDAPRREALAARLHATVETRYSMQALAATIQASVDDLMVEA